MHTHRLDRAFGPFGKRLRHWPHVLAAGALGLAAAPAFAFAPAPAPAGDAQATAPKAAAAPSVQRLATLPMLTGTTPSAPRWSPDEKKIAFLWNDGGWPFRDVWVADAAGGAPRRLTRLEGDSPAKSVAFGTQRPTGTSLDALAREMDQRERGGVGDLVWAPDGKSIYFAFGGAIHRVGVTGGEVKAITSAGAGKSALRLSPDGRWLSYVEVGDLWLLNLATGETRQATRIGAPGIGTVAIGAMVGPDAAITAYEWSPASDRIAFVHTDRRQVRVVPFPSYLQGDEPILHKVRRSYPGDTLETRRVGVLTLGAQDPAFVSLPDADKRSILDCEWSPRGDRLLIQSDSDDAEHRWIHVADARDLSVREIHHDQRPRRIYSMFEAEWSADGREIFMISDADRYYRIAAIPADGGKLRPVTPDSFDVAGNIKTMRGSGDLLFLAAAPTPYERQLYRIPAKGGTPVRVTSSAGTHEPSYSPSGANIALVSGSDQSPPELFVTSARGGGERRLTRSPIKGFDDFKWAGARYVSFPSRAGDFQVHARIIAPPDLDPSKSYPVIIGNIYSNTARNNWLTARPIGLLQQHQVLAKDYIVVQVDLRGSLGYGVSFREAFQGDWAGGDLDDLLGAVDYLTSLPYVDPKRIGIWGNSYGGLMTLAALFKHPGVFAAGVAGAPAVDPPRFLGSDQHLSRYPKDRPEVFTEQSLLKYGENLRDPLLFLHSFHDDIVPLLTTLQMSEKLMHLGKKFEMAIPSNTGHWWAGREHYAAYTLGYLQDFLDEHVGPGAREKDAR
ncbi:prolyl oligopeptidase family serine peptidase [Sphingomonas changnyeongensis]|uniref:Prolyl oligopeptidase family serine peptidase n=1 Tax=Sphingomonas changnyeongensis TaxID=2698679 RepID=A0A7Z2NYA1_9SPHN|nr:prolyl oligopeptidase family serine peptidase [Sphingomonas changnyeongensis]QHL91622.1 prolyl oligopeptidase family serine peptidase [Sphingomonas changnyeongensis]